VSSLNPNVNPIVGRLGQAHRSAYIIKFSWYTIYTNYYKISSKIIYCSWWLPINNL